jgi:nickel-dependent lactate racemase
MREPLATEGSIANNPLHEELLEIAAMARHDFILDVTLTKDRAISGVFAGAPVEAHAAGVDFIRNTSLTQLPQPVDAVITSAAGHPLDLTFYQSVKGITAAQHIVRPGGRILIVSRCEEGIGSPEFARVMQSYTSHDAFLRSIEGAPVEVDQWQTEKLALAGLQHQLLFYTPGADRDQLGSLGKDTFTDVNDAVAALLKGLPAGARVALIPEGPYAFAQVAE